MRRTLENPVKIPLLPDLDLARIAPLAPEQKRAALESFRISHPPYSYLPVRKLLSDILNVQSGFLPAGPRVPWGRIEQLIYEQSRSDAEFEANRRVAEGLYNHAVAAALLARKQDFRAFNVGVGAGVEYWHSLLLIEHDQPLVPLFDPRRSTKNLTELARRFVFSVMHERIRVADPDFAEVRLGIFQFTVPEKGPRIPRLYTAEGLVLFTYEEIESMIGETYEVWTEVYLRRTERIRKRG
jgi:hypothetical protein